MIKTYVLTRPYHNYSFILSNKSGQKLRYVFEGGNTLTNVKAHLTLRSQYAQELLESSEEFKTGFVRIERTVEGGETPTIEKKEATVVDSITSPEQLLEFVAVNLGKVYQRPDAALVHAKAKGFEFPNLDLKKKEE
ncbi:MAG: hypothetical protein K6D91_06005 [Prevotella sp.]|nr:hypothetical protein [Prevotella sp.]